MSIYPEPEIIHLTKHLSENLLLIHVFTYISNAELILYIPAVILTNSTEIQVSRGLFLIIIVS
jgi:hypothetical protein